MDEILKPLNLDIDQFIKICDKFTNKKVFKVDARGNLVKDKDYNLVKLYYPNNVYQKPIFLKDKEMLDKKTIFFTHEQGR